MRFVTKALIVTAATVALAGCGGGGDSTATSGNGAATGTGGDSVIQSFGGETPKAQLTQASTTADSYLGAVAAGKWEQACSDLSSLLKEKFTQLGDKSPLSKGKGCAGGIETLLSKMPKATLQDATLAHATSLRARDGLGLLIYRNDAGKTYRLPMRRERGKWKASAPIGAPLA